MQTELLLRQRQSLIQDRLRQSGRVLAVDLAQEFNVSEDTIRRDLRELAAAGLCERVYGGALPVAPGGTTLSQRAGEAPGRKAALAAAAVPLLTPGMTVFFDASSTNLAIARALPAGLELTAVTNTPLIAAVLMEKPGHRSHPDRRQDRPAGRCRSRRQGAARCLRAAAGSLHSRGLRR
jgi:DeoR/GlpR family transcriptional regulator of sugar metabolism